MGEWEHGRKKEVWEKKTNDDIVNGEPHYQGYTPKKAQNIVGRTSGMQDRRSPLFH